MATKTIDELNEELEFIHDKLKADAIEKGHPMYYDAFGLPVEMWHDSKMVFIHATDEVLQKLGIDLAEWEKWKQEI